MCRLSNDPGTTNDSDVRPQMIPGPEMFPANDTAEIKNGVDSMKSLWMYIFFKLF